jgi:hypothetical protein
MKAFSQSNPQFRKQLSTIQYYNIDGTDEGDTVTDLIEPFAGILLGFLTFLLAELRRRRRAREPKTDPPPPQNTNCRNCFFYKEFVRLIREMEKK